VHAAAGGVGLLLVQMAHNIGALVIGTVSTEQKAKLARQAGADEVILYTQVDFEAESKRLTGGKGVDVLYDSVGKTTFDKGLNVLRPRGYMVLYGGSSGPVPPFEPTVLNQKGSLFLTRPVVRERLEQSYSETGRPSIGPELALRILLIGYLYGITSERKLVEELRIHLAWRWFTGLGFDQGDSAPLHVLQEPARTVPGVETVRTTV